MFTPYARRELGTLRLHILLIRLRSRGDRIWGCRREDSGMSSSEQGDWLILVDGSRPWRPTYLMLMYNSKAGTTFMLDESTGQALDL